MYDAFAPDYDRFVNWTNRLAAEMPFLEAQLTSLQPPAGQSLQVLDAACGTAMHAVALARLGYEVSGADLNEAMIHQARLNSSAAGVGIKLKTAGFGALAATFGTSSFDAILCLGNSLPHLLKAEDLRAALQDFAACLRPGGLLLIQNRNFDAVVSGRQRWMEPQAHSENGSEWVFFRYYDFNPSGLIDFNIVTARHEANGQRSVTLGSTQLRPQLYKELNVLLQECGFAEVRSYGSLQGELFVPLNSGNLVLSAHKKA